VGFKDRRNIFQCPVERVTEVPKVGAGASSRHGKVPQGVNLLGALRAGNKKPIYDNCTNN
jgi:hypothetical protein